MIVCLFGADGSGKSTLAALAASRLRRRGYHVRLSWMRGTHTLASLVARLLSVSERFRGPCNPYYDICLPPSARRAWLWLELVSALPVVLFRFLLPRIAGRLVLAERSPLDFLAWLLVTLRGGVSGSLAWRIAVSTALSLCDRVVYVRADESVLLARRRGYREERLIPVFLRAYDRLASCLNAGLVDTSDRSVEESLGALAEAAGVRDELGF